MFPPPSEKSRLRSFFGLDNGISSIHEYRSSKTCSSISTITERNIWLFEMLHKLMYDKTDRDDAKTTFYEQIAPR